MAIKTVSSAVHDVGAAERALSTNLTSPTGALSMDGAETVLLKAPSTNVGTVYLGPTGVLATNGFPLAPGESIAIDASELSAIFAIGTAGDDVALLALIRG